MYVISISHSKHSVPVRYESVQEARQGVEEILNNAELYGNPYQITICELIEVKEAVTVYQDGNVNEQAEIAQVSQVIGDAPEVQNEGGAE